VVRSVPRFVLAGVFVISSCGGGATTSGGAATTAADPPTTTVSKDAATAAASAAATDPPPVAASFCAAFTKVWDGYPTSSLDYLNASGEISPRLAEWKADETKLVTALLADSPPVVGPALEDLLRRIELTTGSLRNSELDAYTGTAAYTSRTIAVNKWAAANCTVLPTPTVALTTTVVSAKVVAASVTAAEADAVELRLRGLPGEAQIDTVRYSTRVGKCLLNDKDGPAVARLRAAFPDETAFEGPTRVHFADGDWSIECAKVTVRTVLADIQPKVCDMSLLGKAHVLDIKQVGRTWLEFCARGVSVIYRVESTNRTDRATAQALLPYFTAALPEILEAVLSASTDEMKSFVANA
jgi:hypothetical protein